MSASCSCRSVFRLDGRRTPNSSLGQERGRERHVQLAHLRERLERENRVGDRSVLEKLGARLEVGDECCDRRLVRRRVARRERRERVDDGRRNGLRTRQRRGERGSRVVLAEDQLRERGRVAADRALRLRGARVERPRARPPPRPRSLPR